MSHDPAAFVHARSQASALFHAQLYGRNCIHSQVRSAALHLQYPNKKKSQKFATLFADWRKAAAADQKVHKVALIASLSESQTGSRLD